MRTFTQSLLLLILSAVSAAAASTATPHWIGAGADWTSHSPPSRFVKNFQLAGDVTSAELRGVADFCKLKIRCNDEAVAAVDFLESLFRSDVTDRLRRGVNTFSVEALAGDGPSAFFLQLKLIHADGSVSFMQTDSSWQMTPLKSNRKTTTIADLGPINPDYWDLEGNGIQVDVFADYEQWQDAKTADAGTPASQFQIPPGFEIELLRSAKPQEDSWIAMAFDPKGRLIVAREKKGLLRMTLPNKGGGEMKVEIINDDIPEVRGILWAHNALYLNSNSHNLKTTPRDRAGGLFRLRDTNGDDQFDEVRQLGERTATGGHGRNDLTLGPDGKIYMIHGDSVALPKKFKDLTPPVAKFLPGDDLSHGHVIRTDKDGRNWELVSKGLRNPYGIDFNADGEMFTYDADAEFDMGSPWYRPTHVRHLVQGADYGWRRVTGKWPPYFCDHADNPPTTLVIGKGSPTSVKFGTKSGFPDRYKNSLFVMDWTYGRIFAVHMTPRGASYAAKAEPFLRGRPANVTDLDFGPDGAMYFVTGGRGTQSGLYRVTWAGSDQQPVRPGKHAIARARQSMLSRGERRIIETGSRDPSSSSLGIDDVFTQDPWLRAPHRRTFDAISFSDMRRDEHIFRLLFQSQLPGGLNENGFFLLDSSLETQLSAARNWPAQELPWVANALNGLHLHRFPPGPTLETLRIYEIVLLRMPELAPNLKSMISAKLLALFPSRHADVNRELAKLLIQLEAADAVPRTMKLMEAATEQRERFHYLFLLRDASNGWTDELRERYFIALRQTSEFRGGAGLPKFLKQIKDDALAAVPNPAARPRYAALMNENRAPKLDYAKLMADRTFVKEWTLDDLANAAANDSSPRSFENGKKMYSAAACVLCHQLGGDGRVFGPDLTSVASRFSRRDILESIVAPSKVVSEKYRNVTIETTEGESYTGQIVLQGDYRKSGLKLAPNPFDPDQIQEIPKIKIASQTQSLVSAMPAGLLNTLTQEDILDLLAYVESGGNEEHPTFRRRDK
ncbi:MAG: putative heme-binding domain-containing protein [Candidatus Binatia bacterium]|jgi:putative heme-binding domain-containing protein